MRIIRTAQVMFQIAKNVRETAPNAWIFNYTNPMSMVTWSLMDGGPTGGGGRARQDCRAVSQHPGRLHSLGQARRCAARGSPVHRGGDQSRRFLHHAGAQGQKHLSGPVGQERRNPQERAVSAGEIRIARAPRRLAGGDGASPDRVLPLVSQDAGDGGGPICRAVDVQALSYDKKGNAELNQLVDDQISGKKPIDYKRSHEFGAWMIHSIETNTPRVIYGNVRNHGLIDNLPARAVVEVPCLVDANGVQPTAVGRIPMPFASVMQPHISLHEMAVEAVKTKNKKLLYQAIGCDPLASMALTLDKLKAMTDELLEENARISGRLSLIVRTALPRMYMRGSVAGEVPRGRMTVLNCPANGAGPWTVASSTTSPCPARIHRWDSACWNSNSIPPGQRIRRTAIDISW